MGRQTPWRYASLTLTRSPALRFPGLSGIKFPAGSRFVAGRWDVTADGGSCMGSYVFDDLVLPRKFLRMCRRNLRRTKIADSSGLELTGGALLTATLALQTAVAAGSAGHRRDPRGHSAAALGRLGLVERGPHARPPHSRQSELHGHFRTDQRQHGPVRHPPRADQPADARSLPAEARCRVGLCRGIETAHDLVRQAAGRRGRLAAAGRGSGTPAGHHRGPARRRGDGHVHVRLDRPAQGRDADLCQHRCEPARDRQHYPFAPRAMPCWACCRCSTPSATRSRCGRC